MDGARRFRKSLLFLCKALVFGVLISLLALLYLYPADDAPYKAATFWLGGNILVIFLYAVLLVVFSSVYNATRFGVLRLGEIIYSFGISIFMANLIIWMVFCLIARTLLSPLWLIILTAVQVLVTALFSWWINKLYFRLYPPRKLAVIYSDRKQAMNIIGKMTSRWERYQVCVALHEGEDHDIIMEAVKEYGAVLLCRVNAGLEDELFDYCNRNGKRVYLLPAIKDISIRASATTQLYDTPLFYCKNAGPTTEQLLVKRVMDVAICAIALIPLSVIMLLVAAAIWLYDRGPILYKQQRLTRFGKVFTLYKFRSMRVDAEKYGAQLSSKNDPRVTPVGRVIRMLRMDELPQLLNILRGDMSLVGPRPERPEIAAEYEKNLPDFSLRLQMKAGLTGYAQVYGNYSSNIQDKLLLDMMYIENYSLLMDLRLLFMTLKILFMPESTEGIAEGAKLPSDMEKPKS